tara:strand:- start:353 stop:1081 length:729 start_codon:yes stop_codon:yes gene_type:complete
MIFEYDKLREFYSKILSLGETKLFRDWKDESVFLIRHDIDFDLELAHRVALIESEMGIYSTFFILTTCPSYNILAKKNRSLLIKIKEMGHEIALHFDPTLYLDNLDAAVDRETQILSFAVGDEISSISLHNPTSHGLYPIFDKYVNAYSSELFNSENYISDSCFSFRDKDPFSFLKNIKNGMVQILLHPMHFSENGDGYDKILADTFIRNLKEIHENFYSVNLKYRSDVGDNILDIFNGKLK